ncbi:hypothetical protein [Dyella choica]|uniref:Uncharacterized protein n=1 Tax=Dyella choica TaxID=1927959 RepID=A0A3S0PKR7_9GAMM|nr:hypothetical protein [Dyella choica]RUL78881.1 hypothetical protein EKH80_03510 [Dyella choica]
MRTTEAPQSAARGESVAWRKPGEVAESPLQAMIDQSPRMTAQRRMIADIRSGTAPRQLAQLNAAPDSEGTGIPGAASEQSMLEQDPDTRKEQAREDLLATIDDLDGADGQQLERVLAQLQEKYALSKTVVDVDDPENLKVELYASPPLVIAGAALGIVAIATMGAAYASYTLRRRVTYHRTIRRLTTAGYRRDDAEALFRQHNNERDLIDWAPVLRRQIEDRVAIDEAMIAGMQIYDRSVTRLVTAGYRRHDAEALFRLHGHVDHLIAWAPILRRQIEDGVAIDQEMLTNVLRQHGAADKMEELQRAGDGKNLAWGEHNPGLNLNEPGHLTELGRWINDKNNNPEPDPVRGTMNCWEVIWFSAYKMRYITWEHMHEVYQNELEGTSLNTYFNERIRVGAQKKFDPNNADSGRPLRGDIVLFGSAEVHTAMATGTEAGPEGKRSPEVFSLWTQPNHNYLQRVTINALLAVDSEWDDDDEEEENEEEEEKKEEEVKSDKSELRISIRRGKDKAAGHGPPVWFFSPKWG